MFMIPMPADQQADAGDGAQHDVERVLGGFRLAKQGEGDADAVIALGVALLQHAFEPLGDGFNVFRVLDLDNELMQFDQLALHRAGDRLGDVVSEVARAATSMGTYTSIS